MHDDGDGDDDVTRMTMMMKLHWWQRWPKQPQWPLLRWVPESVVEAVNATDTCDAAVVVAVAVDELMHASNDYCWRHCRHVDWMMTTTMAHEMNCQYHADLTVTWLMAGDDHVTSDCPSWHGCVPSVGPRPVHDEVLTGSCFLNSDKHYF